MPSLRHFAFLVGIAQFLAAIGALSGELPLAWLLERVHWRESLLLLAIIGMILTGCSFMIVKDNPYNKRHIPKKHDLKRELKEIIRSSQTWWIGLYAFCGWCPIAVFAALWGVPYLKMRFEVTTAQAALAMACAWISVGGISPVIGWVSDKLGKRCPLLKLCSLIGLISSVVLLYFPGVSFKMTFPLLLGMGIASSGQILSFALVKDNNRPTTTGTAVGLNNMAVVAGGAIFQPLVGAILHFLWNGAMDGEGIPLYSVGNYQVGLLIVPVCFFIGLIVSLFFIKETYCLPKYDAEIV